MSQIIDLDVCDSCITVMANGPQNAEDLSAQAMMEELYREELAAGWVFVAGYCGEQADYCHFSWYACDTCNGAPGQRHLAHMMPPRREIPVSWWRRWWRRLKRRG